MTKMRTSKALALAVGAYALSACSSPKTTVPDRPSDIELKIDGSSVPYSAQKPLPISFDGGSAVEYTIDVRVLNDDGSTRTSFDGPKAWIYLTVDPGAIVDTRAPDDSEDPNVVFGSSVHLVQGEAKGIKVRVVGAYSDTRLIAQDIGFVPAKDVVPSQCSDGIDNDGNGFADYPIDPGCAFLNDDTEEPFDSVYGISPIINYATPRVHDVQGPNTSPFNNRQVDIPGTDPVEMYVSALTKDGMYFTDLESDLAPADRHGYNSLFVYNFNPPPEIFVCDRLTRISGNVSIFLGAIQLGTAAWNKVPWLNDATSGPCRLPDYVAVTDSFASITAQMQPIQADLVKIANPTIGTHFGPKVAPGGIPADGASNCDLNDDHIAGCVQGKPGYRVDEDACCTACAADTDCTEWNDYLSFAQIKIRFGSNIPAAQSTLLAQFSLVPNFDPTQFVGDGKFAELRGFMSTLVISGQPPFTINPRCGDDVVFPLGQDPNVATCQKDEDCPLVGGAYVSTTLAKTFVPKTTFSCTAGKCETSCKVDEDCPHIDPSPAASKSCTDAGGACLARTSTSCANGSVGDKTKFDCGGDPGVDCCLPSILECTTKKKAADCANPADCPGTGKCVRNVGHACICTRSEEFSDCTF